MVFKAFKDLPMNCKTVRENGLQQEGKKTSTPSRSFIVASLRLSFPRMEAAVSHCLRLMGYSLQLRECLTLELVMRMTRPGSVRGTGVASSDLSNTFFFLFNFIENIVTMSILCNQRPSLTRCLYYLQSMSNAWPSLPRTDTN